MSHDPENTEIASPAEDVGVTEAASKPVARWAIHRRMYDWVLSFAHKKHATTALFVISFAESSFFPIPPDVLLGPLCLGDRRRSMWFAAVTTVGSVLGAFLGYFIGVAFLEVAVSLIPGISREAMDHLAGKFNENGELYVFVAALTPIPFKLLTITAGAAKMNLGVFFAACVVGRSARFFAVAGLCWLVGPRALPLIDKYFNILCLVFGLLLGGGFVILKMMH